MTDEHELADESLEIIDEAAEGYQFTRYLDMPQTLTRCLQDTDTKGIKIRHKMKFRIQLHNPDGHISEVGLQEITADVGLDPNSIISCAQHCLYRFISPRTSPLMKTTTSAIPHPNKPAERLMRLSSKPRPYMESTSSISFTARWIQMDIGHQGLAAAEQGLLLAHSVAISLLKTSLQ